MVSAAGLPVLAAAAILSVEGGVLFGAEGAGLGAAACGAAAGAAGWTVFGGLEGTSANVVGTGIEGAGVAVLVSGVAGLPALFNGAGVRRVPGAEFKVGAGAFGIVGTTVRGVIVGARTFGCGCSALLALRVRCRWARHLNRNAFVN